MLACQLKIAEKRRQGLDDTWARLEKGDLVGVLANAKTRKAGIVDGTYLLEGVVVSTARAESGYYKIRWKTRGLGGEKPGSIAKRRYHCSQLKLLESGHDVDCHDSDEEGDTSGQSGDEGDASTDMDDALMDGAPWQIPRVLEPKKCSTPVKSPRRREKTEPTQPETGVFLAVPARQFGKTWAKKEHGGSYNSVWYTGSVSSSSGTDGSVSVSGFYGRPQETHQLSVSEVNRAVDAYEKLSQCVYNGSGKSLGPGQCVLAKDDGLHRHVPASRSSSRRVEGVQERRNERAKMKRKQYKERRKETRIRTDSWSGNLAQRTPDHNPRAISVGDGVCLRATDFLVGNPRWAEEEHGKEKDTTWYAGRVVGYDTGVSKYRLGEFANDTAGYLASSSSTYHYITKWKQQGKPEPGSVTVIPKRTCGVSPKKMRTKSVLSTDDSGNSDSETEEAWRSHTPSNHGKVERTEVGSQDATQPLPSQPPLLPQRAKTVEERWKQRLEETRLALAAGCQRWTPWAENSCALDSFALCEAAAWACAPDRLSAMDFEDAKYHTLLLGLICDTGKSNGSTTIPITTSVVRNTHSFLRRHIFYRHIVFQNN